MPRWWILALPLVVVACAAPEDGAPDASSPEPDGGTSDAGSSENVDGGVPYEAPVIKTAASLFWTQSEMLDDPAALSFSKTMATIAPDGHGGRLLDAWFRRFSTTAHSERVMPAQFMDELTQAQGTNPANWNLTTLPFKVTGVHNRIDLAALRPDGHCGELRISFSSTHAQLQPFHILFLFQQPLTAGDIVNGKVTCEATAREWAELSRLSGAELINAVRAILDRRFTRANFLLAETVELTVSPWEWRQWFMVPDPNGQLPFVLDNQPLFQTADVEALNAQGALRSDFLNFVTSNAAQLDARTLLIPERFRRASARVTQGVPRTPLDLSGLPSNVASSFPNLRQNIELVGCPVCHTADAEFVQTRTDRTVSKFYELELLAREAHLATLARGEAPIAKFGPLQPNPKLPP